MQPHPIRRARRTAVETSEAPAALRSAQRTADRIDPDLTPAVTRRRARVLVVDDDAEMRAYLEEELREAGYETLSAPNAIDGLIALLGEKPDVIVLDWKMPLLDGFSLLGSISRCAPGTPVIFVTAYGRPEISFKAMHDGAFAFIPKPFPLSRLLTEIEDALSIATASRRPRRPNPSPDA